MSACVRATENSNKNEKKTNKGGWGWGKGKNASKKLAEERAARLIQTIAKKARDRKRERM